MAIRMPQTEKPANADKKAEAFISGAGLPLSTGVADGADSGKATVNMRFDTALLKRIDASAKRQGISRTAWLHVAASKALEDLR